MSMGKYLRILLAGMFCLMSVEFPMIYAQSASNDQGSRRSSRSSRRGDDTTNDRDRRRESRSRDRESNSRRSSRSSRSDKDEKADDKDSKTVEASKKKSSGGSKGSGGGGRPPIEITFEMQADPETNIMYLESTGANPTLNMSVLENKQFVTRVALYNAKSSEFNQFDISLKYDPQLLEPLGIDDSAISSTLSQPARVLVDRKLGLLSMSGDFNGDRNDSFMTLAKIQWKALAPAAATPIRFLNSENHPSGVFDKYGDNILHAKSNTPMAISPVTGLLNATVAIEPPNGQIALSDEGSNPFSTVALATNISMGTAEGGMQLYLRPRRNAIGVGEVFLVDILYKNPKHADLDTMKLEIRFDPTVLQVRDYDEGNWITRGINIFDGAYHGDLPFDFHRKNVAYNTTGLIQYDMGFSDRTPVHAEGVIATIRFEAIEADPQTVVYFDVDRNQQDLNASATASTQPNTIISFLGFNLIGTPGNRGYALHNAQINVQQRTSFR